MSEPGVHGRAIRVTSLVVLLSPDRTMHAVAHFDANRENSLGFHRLIGGGVEVGETAQAAAVRETREELGAELLDVQLLGVLENLFEYDGQPGHEVVFVHTGRLDPPGTVPPEGGLFADNGDPMLVEWRPLDDKGMSIPLYPKGAGDLVRSLTGLT
ncbi:NUDIX hydrolase [Knoellia sinensis KCTC 19936]|uniref:NUDIX hydrolase n=1 Tax=Knoellia sinensis KCTC 19936 TaxID=1385520 RepID=A0A0A0JDT5_9MICO|nr:NUDIX domain-containing protein [Knoellia sinensis]KGN34954.1 NUDIX hydrolase [Knoellia sinensis KCTC 19936]